MDFGWPNVKIDQKMTNGQLAVASTAIQTCNHDKTTIKTNINMFDCGFIKVMIIYCQVFAMSLLNYQVHD